MTLLLWLGCTPAPEPTPPPPADPAPAKASLDLDDPRACAPCHEAVVSEWETSMHAQAHAERDPIYGAMRTLRMKVQGDAVGAQCPVCHDPRAPDDPDSPAGRAGVSCAACHAVAGLHRDRGPGAKALERGDVLRSARDLPDGASPAHPTGPAAPWLADGTSLCLACHDATTNGSGVAACTTGPEHAEGQGASCTSCHMPDADGPNGVVSTRPTHRSHRFPGAHAPLHGDETFLATALDLALDDRSDPMVVTVTNRTGHAFPTGFPGRVAQLVVKGNAADVTWTSPPDLPGTRWGKVYVDADGKPVAAPFSVALKEDTRLRPGETRTIAIPRPTGVDGFRAEVHLRLLPPPLATTLGLDGTPVARPVLVRSTATPTPGDP